MKRKIISARLVLFIFTIGLFSAGCVIAEGMDPEDTPLPPSSSQLEGTLKEDRSASAGLPTLSTVLNKLFADWQDDQEATVKWAFEQGLEIEGNRVKIMLIMLDEGSTDAAMDVIAGLGGEVIDQYQVWIDAWVPIGSLDAIADLPGLSQAREPIETVPLEP